MPLASLRGRLQGTLRPLTGTLVKWGVHPNLLTVIGFALAVGAAVAFDQRYIRTAGLLVLLSGFLDIIDGQVARLSGLGSPFGAFFDATLDRVGEIVVFVGLLGFYLGGAPDAVMIYLVVVAMAGSLMVSYTKSKAETMGLDCGVGLMQRAERVILIGASALFFGLAWGGRVLDGAVLLMALLTAVTAIQRVVWVYRQAASPLDETAAEVEE
jgi:CDP-diacylglycerol--glycerol-3-phosphate 3-phosphatidyltransferase